MAANAPDPKTLKTWEEAFKYPIPAVRRMEQQLRTDVAANKEKLRRLVGSAKPIPFTNPAADEEMYVAERAIGIY